jgi:hypothetical protein
MWCHYAENLKKKDPDKKLKVTKKEINEVVKTSGLQH